MRRVRTVGARAGCPFERELALVLFAGGLALAGCGDPDEERRERVGGRLDVSQVESPFDGSARDATGRVDTGPVPDPDAEPRPRDGGTSRDAAELDAAMPDAFRLPDAATADAAVVDAAVVDADAPALDAGFGPCLANGVAGECIPVADCPREHRPIPGFCPGPQEIQCCVPFGDSPLCDNSVHRTPHAGFSESPGDVGCPPGMARLEDLGVCIDRYEASVWVEEPDGQLTPWSPYHRPPQGVRLVATSLAGAVPQGYIDGHLAEAACLGAGKRLCTDAEWLRACRGPEGRVWPYGEVREPGRCNDARAVHPAVELFPNAPNPFDHIQDACINQLADGLTPTGGHPGCVTPERVFDLAGNLHEWTADPTGTFRGGFYVDTAINGQGCLYRTTAHNRAHWDYSTGFRCCAD